MFILEGRRGWGSFLLSLYKQVFLHFRSKFLFFLGGREYIYIGLELLGNIYIGLEPLGNKMTSLILIKIILRILKSAGFNFTFKVILFLFCFYSDRKITF